MNVMLRWPAQPHVRRGILACACLVTAVCAWPGTASSADAIQPTADPVGHLVAYARLVEEYRRGEGDRALRQIISWKPDAVVFAIHEVEKRLIAGGPLVQAKAVALTFPAAVMLHTEAGLYLNWRGDLPAAHLQWHHARRLAELPPSTPDKETFLRAWYHAAGSFFLGSSWLVEAVSLLERGLRRFPDDVTIARAAAQAYEARGTFPETSAVFRGNLHAQAESDLRRAESLYRGLISRGAGGEEPRLRLGRVLQVRGEPALARATLEAVATATSDARLRYLAHLFAGELLRRSGVSDARREFTKAVAAWPGGQAAALGLAETLHALGEPAASAAALAVAIEDHGQPMPADPFRSYSLGDRADQRRSLERVKEMALR